MTWHERESALFFPTDSDRWLSALRIGLGVVLVSYAWSLRADWNALYAGTGRGLVSRELFEGLLSTQSILVPRLGWFVWFFQRLGFNESFALSFTWLMLLGAGVLLLFGLFSRPVAVVAWFLQLAAAKSGGLFSYGADNFVTIGLFYLMLAPLPDRWSLDWWRGSGYTQNPERLGFYRRLLQLHLCLIYLFSGLTKCLGTGWWNGENLWRALTSPPFDVVPIRLVALFGPVLPVLGALICLLETSYPILIWPRWSRRVVFYGVCAMHAGIGLLMGMYLFAIIMLVLNIAAFSVRNPRGRGASSLAAADRLQIARQSPRIQRF